MSRALFRWRKLPVRVTAEHKAALARALQSRHRKLCEGTLYNTGDERPKDFAEGISIDLGLILIGLIECLGSRRASEDTLKDIIAVFLNSFDPPAADRRLIEAKRFNLDRQFEMLRAWQASSANGSLEAAFPLAHGCCLASEPTRPGFRSYSSGMRVRYTSGPCMCSVEEYVLRPWPLWDLLILVRGQEPMIGQGMRPDETPAVADDRLAGWKSSRCIPLPDLMAGAP